MLKVIELFAGIGSQTQALKEAGIEHEVVAISEIDKYASKAYEMLHGKVNNLGDIRLIQELPEVDLWTYSFPCTDISLAGKQKGFNKGSDTQSSLLWEVERLLNIANDNDELPMYLLMENVKALVSKKFIKEFEGWIDYLESLGYKNFWKVLNAKDYGVPQNRERVFMISIRDENANYEFPEKQELKLKLFDMLEPEADNKYFLSEKLITTFSDMKNRNGFIRGLRFEPHDHNSPYAYTITTSAGNRPTDNFISETVCLNPKVDGKQPSLQNRIYDSNGIATAVTTSFHPFVAIPRTIRGRTQEDGTTKQKIEIREESEVSNALTTVQKDSLVIIVPENTKKGYAVAKVGDGIYTNRPHQKRGVVQKNMIPTLKCSVSDIGVVVDTEEWISIRRLTPRECWRLMGWADENIDKVINNFSNTQLYKMAGNSIVVNVLVEIFNKLNTFKKLVDIL